MYSIYIGFTHPKISCELKKDTLIYDICKEDCDIYLFRNLMNCLVKDRSKKLDFLFDDFFTSRAIDLNTDNEFFRVVKDFFEVFKYNFELKSKNGMKFFLLKVSKERTVDDVIDYWHCSRLNYIE